MPQPSPQETDAPEQTEPVEPEPVESEPAPAEEPAAAEPVAEPPAESVPETPHDDAAEPDEPEDSGIEDKTTIVSDDPDIDALFAKLRQSPEPPVAQEPAPGVEPEPEEPVAPALHVVPPLERGEGFERRDRMPLPIENRGLRGLKRRIVELQNRVLEELRTSSGEWRLGREFVIEVMGDELDAVLLDSYRAGHAAAAESIGREEALLTGGPEQGAAETFTADLHHDVQAVIERDAEGGSKRLSSDVGRVFRAWRTEEAERHVRQAARRAFNDGLLAGYGRLGVEAVEIIAPGRPCGECAADSGITWAPSNGVPEGVKIPPTGRGCAALVVPAGSNGFDSRPDQ